MIDNDVMEEEVMSGQNNADLWRSSLFGALFFLFTYVCGLLAFSGFELMGESDETLSSFVESNYFWFNILYQGALLVTAIIIGGFTGSLAGYAVRKFSINWKLSCLILVGFWFSVELWQVFYHPQFFDGPFLDGKPWLKEILFYPTRMNANLAELIVKFLLAFFLFLLFFSPLSRLFKIVSKSKVAKIIAGLSVFVLATSYSIESLGFANSIYGAAQNRKPNILLLVIDSLRPDHLSINGYERKTTPNIDAIAEKGALFTNMVVDAPRTFPSWVSMMTGRYPFDHGVRHMFPTLEQRQLIYPSFPKVLGDSGYQTVVVSDFAGDIFPRIDFGFQEIDTPDFTFDEVVAMRNLEIHPTLLAFLNNRLGRYLFPAIRELVYNSDPFTLSGDAKRAMLKLDRTRPWMLTVFYSTSHLPYAIPGPFYQRYSDEDYSGPHRFKRKSILMLEGEGEEDVKQIMALYDGGLAAIDESLAPLFDTLKSLGYDSNTVIAITGDHGEAFFEHGADIGHGNHLRGPYAQRVPLVLYDPMGKVNKGKFDNQTRLIDLAPTLANLADVEFKTASGQSIVDIANGKEIGHRTAYSESGLWYLPDGPFFFQKERIRYPGVTTLCEVDTQYRNEVVIKNRYQAITVAAKHRMLSDGNWKLIVMPTPESVTYQLFDIANDPEEYFDIADKRPEVVSRLKAELEKVINSSTNDVSANGYLFTKQGMSQ